AVPGEIALASTYSPRNPCTAQATSVAPCGGHTEKITSASRATTATVPASLSPAALARAAVAALRPSDAHSTVCPRPVRQCPAAAPISPGCSRPITCVLTPTSVAQRILADRTGGPPVAGVEPATRCALGRVPWPRPFERYQATWSSVWAPRGMGVNLFPARTPKMFLRPYSAFAPRGEETTRALPSGLAQWTSWSPPLPAPNLSCESTGFPVRTENSAML